jgi:alkylation response protein AidB-like acyl-CoA dehydrogenase
MATVQEKTEALLKVVRTLEPLIRQHADESEANRRLSQPVVRAMAEAGLFRMWVPQALGGLEVPPLTLYGSSRRLRASMDLLGGAS